MMKEKIDYIHYNPVKRGYIEEAEHWRYSSAKDYAGIDGLLEVESMVILESDRSSTAGAVERAV